jgi:hypothetical protein
MIVQQRNVKAVQTVEHRTIIAGMGVLMATTAISASNHFVQSAQALIRPVAQHAMDLLTHPVIALLERSTMPQIIRVIHVMVLVRYALQLISITAHSAEEAIIYRLGLHFACHFILQGTG